MLKTKCVMSPIDRKADGLRILATRFRGRGLKASRYDVWMGSLGPSERLLKALREDRITWAQFERDYREELFRNGGADSGNKTIKNHGQKFTLRLIKKLAKSGHVTLMCHCPKTQKKCHRHLLKGIILSNKV